METKGHWKQAGTALTSFQTPYMHEKMFSNFLPFNERKWIRRTVCIPTLPTIYKRTQIRRFFWEWACMCRQSIPRFISSNVAWEQGYHTHKHKYLQQWFPLFGVPCEIPASSWKGSYRWCHCSTQRRVPSPWSVTPWPMQWDPLEGGQHCCLIQVRISALTEIMQWGGPMGVWEAQKHLYTPPCPLICCYYDIHWISACELCICTLV